MVLHFQHTDWATHQQALTHIRRDVFMREQGVSAEDEWDNKDENAIHFLAQIDRQAVGCARLLLEQDDAQSVCHIGRVAVLSAFRQQQIGRQLMNFVIQFCKQNYSNYSIYLHAQTSRQIFYHHLHFVARGDVFLDAGIPHIEMWYEP